MQPIVLLAIILAIIHFTIPLIYYYYAKKKWLSKPWDLTFNEEYRPKVTIIIPTYNEAKYIINRLNNIYTQDYPKELIDVVVVDSASIDGTPNLVERWIDENKDFKLKLIKETSRRGKAFALNLGLKYTTGELIVIADADAFWRRDVLKKAMKYLADPTIGALSCIKIPETQNSTSVENEYRKYYNTLRIAESKVYATPIFHGELAIFKKELLKKLGGFPIDIGADDSHTATRIAIMGYRAIIPEDVITFEKIPKKGYNLWRIRRAQHLIQHFLKIFTYKTKIPKRFKQILYMEVFLHLGNPWLLILAIIFLLIATIRGSYTGVVLLGAGIALFIAKPYRAWIISQLFLVLAMVRNLFTKEIIWVKQAK